MVEKERENEKARAQSLDELEATCEALRQENERLKALIQSSEGENSGPIYEKDGWGERIEEFLTKFPSAQKYTSEIGKIIMENPEIAKDNNALEGAYMRLLEKRKTPDELSRDDEFLQEFIFVSPKVRDKIIAEYLAELNTDTPTVMAEGGQTFVTPPRSPKNLTEAMKLAEKLLSK